MKKLDNFSASLRVLKNADFGKASEIDELILLIRDSFVPSFSRLAGVLEEKLAQVE